MATGEVVVRRRKETDSAAEVPTGEYLDPEIVKRTRETLGQFVRRPPLTDKLLNKPPFRFLHDIITAVISTTGFMNGLYSEAELISDNVKERDTKIAFLQKAVDVVAMVTGRSLKMKPAKTVAGQEPEKTNEFLQALAEAITKKTVKNKEVPVGEKAKKKTIPKSKQVDSSGSASVMPDAVIGADESKVEKKKDESKVEKKKDESDVKEPANIVSKQPTVDKKEAAHVTRERKAEAKDATSAASKEKERRRVPAKKDDIAHRPGRVAGGGGGVAEGVKSPVRGRRPETKESRDVKRDKPETRKEKPESKPTSATVRHEAKPERHAKAGEHLEKGRKPTPTTVAKDSGGGAGTPGSTSGSTSGRTPRSEGAVKTRGEHQNRKPDGKERPMEKSVEKSMAHGKVETGIVGTKEVAANKPEMAAHKPEMAANKPEKAANKPEMAAHKPEMAAHKPEVAAHKPEMAAHKPEKAAHKPEMAAKQPDAKIVNSSGENARSLPKEKQLESQKTDAVDPQFKGSGNGKRIIQNVGSDSHKFDRPVLSTADAKADSVRPAAVPATDSHKTGSESTDKSENVNREDTSKYGGKAPQVDKVKAIRPDTVKLNAKVREFAAEIEKPSAAAGKAPVEPQQHHLHVHPPPAAAVVPNVTTKPAPHEQQPAQESVESKNERKARKDEKQRPANPQNRHATDLGNSDTRSEQDRVTTSISEDRRKSDRFSATLTRSEMTKTEGLQMNSHKLTPERENMEKETLADTNIQKPAYSRLESGISAIVDLNFPKISDDDDDDHDDDDDDDDESDEDRFQERGVSNVIAVPGAFQDGSDDDTEHGGLVKKLLKTKKVHEDASISRKTKVEIDRSEMAFNAAKKRQQDQLMQDIAKLQSAIQSFTGNVMPLVMILEFLQEDLDSMKKEMDVWKVEIRTNTAALQQEQRLMESAVEPLQSLLSELEKEIVQQEAVNVALKSQALHNEERIRKMITSASRL